LNRWSSRRNTAQYLAGSALFDSRLVFNADQHFKQRVARFERECARIQEHGPSAPEIVFLGDSLVEGAERWLGWVNRGAASDHMRWPAQNVFERLGATRLHPNPLAVVILVGINDVADAPTAFDEHVSAYTDLLTRLEELHSRARFAIVSLLPTARAASHLNGPVLEFNRRLAALARSRSVPFWDVHAAMYDRKTEAATPAYFRRDGLHLSFRGYARLTLYLRNRQSELSTQKEPVGVVALVGRELRRALERAGPRTRRKLSRRRRVTVSARTARRGAPWGAPGDAPA
jgi:hypothetical protein